MRTIDDIKEANRAAGQFFFSRKTMKFFASRVYPDVIECRDGTALFVTSEKQCFDDPTRVYTIRRAFPSGNVTTASGFGKYPSRHRAMVAARAYAEMSKEDDAA